ncbi:fibronectin type III domain-containing protein [Candidatus Nomurabacteria bacterium]|nr:fibronectin type III domain-containing protein [Candidatus Nomurabacteria bacterium]
MKKNTSFRGVTVLPIVALLILSSTQTAQAGFISDWSDSLYSRVSQVAGIIFGVNKSDEPVFDISRKLPSSRPEFLSVRSDITPEFEKEETPVTRGVLGSARAVNVNNMLLGSAASFVLQLSDELSVIAEREYVEDKNGGIVWVGHIRGKESDRVYLVSRQGISSGIVHYRDRSFELVYAGNGVHSIREINTGYPDQFTESDSILVDKKDLDSSNVTSSAESDQFVDSGETIDILVAYTPEAKDKEGGVSEIESKILTAVTETNDAYMRSGINVTLNLVHMVEAEGYEEVGSMNTSLSRLRSPYDGYMDEIHRLRDQYAADQVVLIVKSHENCGVAYRMATLSVGFESNAFSVVSRNCATGYYSFGHELGHNQGMNHNIESSSCGIFSFSCGYTDCSTFRTIMSYACGGSSRIRNFSSPDYLYEGKPTGTINADNARTLNMTSPTVANFRASISPVVPEVPLAPTKLQATVNSASEVRLAWNDNASDETGYIVRRSFDGVSWTKVAVLSADVTSYVDNGLISDTTYHYKVKAFNSVGHSAHSNKVVVQTLAIPVDTTPPSINIISPKNGSVLPPNGLLTIDVSVTDDTGVSLIKILINDTIVGTCANSNTCSVSKKVEDLDVGNQVVLVRAEDSSGNKSSGRITLLKYIGKTLPGRW